MFRKQTKIFAYYGYSILEPREVITTYSLFGIKLYVTTLKHYSLDETQSLIND